MVGAYGDIVGTRANMPSPHYRWFMDKLLERVRESIAECCESAYASLDVAAAADMLMLDGAAQVNDFVKAREGQWVVDGDTLRCAAGEKASKASEIPSMRLIGEVLAIATEIERIV